MLEFPFTPSRSIVMWSGLRYPSSKTHTLTPISFAIGMMGLCMARQSPTRKMASMLRSLTRVRNAAGHSSMGSRNATTSGPRKNRLSPLLKLTFVTCVPCRFSSVAKRRKNGPTGPWRRSALLGPTRSSCRSKCSGNVPEFAQLSSGPAHIDPFHPFGASSFQLVHHRES